MRRGATTRRVHAINRDIAGGNICQTEFEMRFDRVRADDFVLLQRVPGNDIVGKLTRATGGECFEGQLAFQQQQKNEYPCLVCG